REQNAIHKTHKHYEWPLREAEDSFRLSNCLYTEKGATQGSLGGFFIFRQARASDGGQPARGAGMPRCWLRDGTAVRYRPPLPPPCLCVAPSRKRPPRISPRDWVAHRGIFLSTATPAGTGYMLDTPTAA